MAKGQSLTRLLTPVRNRLVLFRLLRQAALGLAGGSVAGAAVLAAGRLWPMAHAMPLFGCAVAAGLAAGAALGWRRRESLRDAARTVDKLEAEDAVTTALDGLARSAGEGAEREPEIVKLQRMDAEAAVRRFAEGLRTKLPWPGWPAWRTSVMAGASAWVVIAALLIAPNPMEERAQAKAKAAETIGELEEKAEHMAEAAKREGLSGEEAEALLQPLESLREALSSPNVNLEEALKELEAAIRELERAAQAASQAASRLEAAARAMAVEPDLRPLGEALQARDADAARSAIDDLRSRMKELSPEERESLAEALERLAAEQPREAASEELAAALKEAARQVRADSEEASEADPNGDGLAALEEALARALTQGELERLAREMSGSLAEAGRQLAARQGLPAPAGLSEAGAAGSGSATGGGTGGHGGAGGSGSESGASGTAGSGEDASEGASGSSGSGGSGAGESGGEGQGAGGGEGAGGGGNGSGTGSGTGAGGTGAVHGQGSGAGTGNGSRKLVTTPRTMEGSGNVQRDGGPASGGETQTGGQSPMIDGTTRPYEEVYGEYAEEAKRSIGRSQLPAGMQEKVKRYFDEIQPE